MPEENKIFIYRDARGKITAREITNISKSKEHIQGICLKTKSLRTFRKDRVLEYIEEPAHIDKRMKFHLANNPAPEVTATTTRNRNELGKLEICLTGFKKNDKEKLIELAESSDMFIRTRVTQYLHFLCCGSNAGPKKIEAARHQGAVILSECQFKVLLETGEIPEEP